MNKYVLLIALAAFFAGVQPALSMTVGSDFGFQIKLPDNWTAVSKSQVRSKPDLVKGTFEVADKDKNLRDLPAELYSKLKEKIAGGEVEYYYRNDSPGYNISVYEDTGTIAQSGSGVREMCSLLPQELSRVTQKPVTVHECRAKAIGNLLALYVVGDGHRQGQKYVQYLIQKSPNRILMLTATAGSGQDFEVMRTEFDEIMRSFKLL
ncbi:MAG: hypothetical protein AB1512_22615 [Thermodesulfobacteriota bacterium]